jgi:hypothetical protein
VSYRLDSLLDAARRRDCELNDAARLQQEMDMRRRTRSASRAFVEMQARQQQPAASEFHITVVRFGQPDVSYCEQHADRLDAFFAARDRFGPGAVIDVNVASWSDLSMMGAAQ